MLSIKNIYSLFIIFFFYQANAQHNLKLVVQNLSATHLNDTVYVAGNFNGWNPGKTAMAFQQDKNVWEIILSLPTDQYEFKFTGLYALPEKNNRIYFHLKKIIMRQTVWPMQGTGRNCVMNLML